MVNPLILSLQSNAPREEASHACPSNLVMLLEAKCDPNELGTPQQSPLLYAVGLQDTEVIEDLLIAGADVNYAPAGQEPPLCVAVRHCMGSIAKTLLTYQADVAVRGLVFGPLDVQDDVPLGPTPIELASADRAMARLLMAYQTPNHQHRMIEMVN